MKRVLIDTGPLVAILSPDEQTHELCSSTLKNLTNPPITCWPVITEATWLLRGFPQAIKGLLSSINVGIIEILQVDSTEAGQIAMIMDQFASLRAQFVDAMLVYLAHRETLIRSSP